MTIRGVTRMWSRHDADIQDSRVSITENYQVVHDHDDNWAEIYNAVDPDTGLRVPVMHDVYEENGLVLAATRVNSSKLTQVSPIMSIVTITYEGTDPTIEPTAGIKVSWTDTESDEPIDEDFDGNPIVTVNREPIEGVTTKIADQVVTIERRFLDFNAYLINAYRHSTNSDTFLGYLPGMARLVRYSASLNGGMWDVSASIQFRYPYRTTPAKAWYARVRHEGYYVKDGSVIRRALDSDLTAGSPGEPVVKPVLLKSDGTIETNPANAHWLEFKRYGSLPYNALGLL